MILHSAAERLKILFTSTHSTSFIQEDLELLRRHFEVDHLTTNGIGAALNIFSSVRHSDVTFTWFASVYSSLVVFFAKRNRKKSIIVIGGVDAARYPEIHYGVWLSWWKAMLVKYAIRNAHKVLAVDPFQQKELMRLAEYDGKNIEYVPTGYDAEAWSPLDRKEQFVLTVAKCENATRMKVKGLEMLFASACKLPHVRFLVIGLGEHLVQRVRETAPSNVEIIPFVQRDQLLSYYRRAKVYCQPSYIEGLPNSVCEAMLCECVPVGTNVGGIPTAIRDIGFLVPYGDVDALSEAIEKGLQAAPSVGRAARKYIADTFPSERRKEALLRIIQGAAG